MSIADAFSHLTLVIFYLIGCFPSGHIIALSKGIDIRTTGSGNVGATNVARSLGKKAGLLTLLLDIIKGIIAVALAQFIYHDNYSSMCLAGLFCVLGHCFSIPKYLKGGKGVATALGVVTYLNYWFAVIAIIAFVVSMLVFRIVSVSSLISVVAVSITALMFNLPQSAWIPIALISLVIFYRHKDNLSRLIRGEEKRFSFKK